MHHVPDTATSIRSCVDMLKVGAPLLLYLSYYRKHSFYTMRTDARDRLSTPLEQCFTRQQICKMMIGAGLVNVRLSDAAPYWYAVGDKEKPCADLQVS